MFKPYQRHPFELRLAHVLIAFFTLAVIGGLYYILGGPIPYLINWNGPRGEAFTGRYEILSRLPPNPEEALASGRTFEATYPYTVMVWGGRRAGVVAAAQNQNGTPALNSITVHRGPVVCSAAQRWGVETSVVCTDKYAY
jgi:hypothetical protein